MSMLIGCISRGTAHSTAIASSSSSSFSGSQVIPKISKMNAINKNVGIRNRTVKVDAVAAEPEREILQRPDAAGRYGRYGGKYVPETLIAALADLEQSYAEAMNDPAFLVRLCEAFKASLFVGWFYLHRERQDAYACEV